MFRRAFIALCICVGITLGAISAIAHADSLIVDAKANIFGAGHSTPPAPGGGGGGVLPPVFTFVAGAGKVVKFSSVTGTVSCCSGGSTFNDPDGGPFAGGRTNINSTGGISGIIHDGKTMFLVGVFLDDTEPVDPAPARLDFTGADDFAVLAPLLRQVFFIGDGLTGTAMGSVQQFGVPAGATRLFLGFADAFGFQGDPGFYDDDVGELTATFQITGGGPVCDIQLNQTAFVNGDQVIAQVARLANPGLNPVPVEVKLWFELPGNQPPFPFLTVGADGSFVLSPGFNQDFGPLPLATVQASTPPGQYSFNCRLLHAVTGAPLAEDANPFQLQ